MWKKKIFDLIIFFFSSEKYIVKFDKYFLGAHVILHITPISTGLPGFIKL